MKVYTRWLLVFSLITVYTSCGTLGLGSRLILLEEATVITSRGATLRGVIGATTSSRLAAFGTMADVRMVSGTVTPSTLASLRATLTAEEMGLIEGTVANRQAFNRLFQRVWLDKKNAFYIRGAENQPLHFAELVDHDLIKLYSNQKYYKLPGTVFRIKSTSRVKVRTGPYETANIYSYVEPGRPILVLERLNNDWAEVMIGDRSGLFILSSLLTPCEFIIDTTIQTNEEFKILSPLERDELPYPRITKVVWTSHPQADNYILQVELSDRPFDYTSTVFSPLPYSPFGIYQTHVTTATFEGMGQQVHRFRVIAKSGNTTITTTEWRYINYTQ